MSSGGAGETRTPYLGNAPYSNFWWSRGELNSKLVNANDLLYRLTTAPGYQKMLRGKNASAFSQVLAPLFFRAVVVCYQITKVPVKVAGSYSPLLILF